MSAHTVRLWIDVTLVDGADPDEAAEHLYDLAADDPSDVAPEIETVCNFGYEEEGHMVRVTKAAGYRSRMDPDLIG